MKMKKKLLSIFVSLIALFTCLVLPACKDNGVVGTYKLYQIIETDKTFNLGDEWDGNILTENFYELILFDNERFILSGANMDTIEGEWGQAENKIIIRSDYPNDDDIILTYDKSQKTLTSEIVGGDYDIVWKKQ